MSFGVGDLVECVDDGPGGPAPIDGPFLWQPCEGITRGSTYTVREVGITSLLDGVSPCIRLVEARNGAFDSPYRAARFRPIRKTSIEVFRKIDADVFDGVRA